MRTKVSICVLAQALALAGCATQHTTQDAEAVKQYCAKEYADPRLDPLRSKIMLPITVGAPQPIEILANRERPTDPERSLILLLSKLREDCNKFAVDQLGPPPAYRVASQDHVSAELADLYAGDLTYGCFAKALLYIGERDALAREDLDAAIQQKERWLDQEMWN
jgi:hypothetical protein